MTPIFEDLFDAWCPSNAPGPIPEHLRNNPTRAYAIFTFELGFKLAWQLASGILVEDLGE